MAELSRLLGFMSAWDRRDALMKYEALFDGADDEAELIASLGTPTKLAIGLALNYVPSPAPAVRPAENSEPDGSVGEFAAGGQPEAAPDAAEEPVVTEPAVPAPAAEEEEGGVSSMEEISAAEDENAGNAAPEAAAEEPAPELPKRKLRAIGLVGSILFGLVIGLPVALVLIVLGVPFIVLGASIAGAAVWCAMGVIGMLAMFSDVLMIIGATLLLCALGLLLVWFGLWLSFELGYLWISGAVLRLGRTLTYKEEVAAE